MSIQWALVLFTLIAGAGAGLMVFIGGFAIMGVAKKTQGMASIVAVALILVGACCSVAHLQQPANVMAAVTNLGSFSGISIELMLVSVTAILGIVYFICYKRDVAEGTLKILAVIMGAVGLIFTYAIGSSYMMESREAWNTVALPLAYLGTNLAMGGFLAVAIAAALKEEVGKVGTILVLVAAVLESVFLVAYAAIAGIEAMAAANAVLFWGGMIVCGAVAALVLAVVLLKKNGVAVAAAGLVCAAIGGISLRCLMWLIGVAAANFFAIPFYVL